MLASMTVYLSHDIHPLLESTDTHGQGGVNCCHMKTSTFVCIYALIILTELPLLIARRFVFHRFVIKGSPFSSGMRHLCSQHVQTLLAEREGFESESSL